MTSSVIWFAPRAPAFYDFSLVGSSSSSSSSNSAAAITTTASDPVKPHASPLAPPALLSMAAAATAATATKSAPPARLSPAAEALRREAHRQREDLAEDAGRSLLAHIVQEVPWASFLVSLGVLLVSREVQRVQEENMVVTLYNRDNFSLPYVAKEHVPTLVFVLWSVFMGFALLAIEVFVVRSGTFRHRLAYGINLLFTLLESFFVGLSLTEFAKHWVAMPRPDFIARCLGSVTAQAQYNPDGSIICTHPLGDGRQSFPSGHSCGSMVTGTFCTAYLVYFFYFRKVDLPWRDAKGRWYRRWLQQIADALFFFICCWPLVVALYIATSRVVDHRHSTADITAGCLLGFLVALPWFARALARDHSLIHGRPQRPVTRRFSTDDAVQVLTPLLESAGNSDEDDDRLLN